MIVRKFLTWSREVSAGERALGLTAAFMMGMLLTGDRSLFTAELADLSGLPLQRVAGFVRVSASGGFAAVYARGMPSEMLPVFRSALAAQEHHNITASSGQGDLLRPLVSFVFRDCGRMDSPPSAQLQALLHKFEAEAARDMPLNPVYLLNN